MLQNFQMASVTCGHSLMSAAECWAALENLGQVPDSSPRDRIETGWTETWLAVYSGVWISVPAGDRELHQLGELELGEILSHTLLPAWQPTGVQRVIGTV